MKGEAFPIIISPDQLKSKHQQELHDPRTRSDFAQVCLILPQELCGCVIGKGAQFLRHYKPKFGGFVYAFTNFPPTGISNLPGSSERIVSITGEPTSVANTHMFLQKGFDLRFFSKYCSYDIFD